MEKSQPDPAVSGVIVTTSRVLRLAVAAYLARFKGLSAETATRRLEEHYGVGQDQDFDNDFWLGLAATQHRLGHVDEYVIQQALAIIDSSAELQRWQPADRRRRSAVLGKLRGTLTQPPPQPRKVRPRKTVNTALSAGQHVIVPSAHGHGVLLRVVGVNEDKGGRYAIAIAVAWDGNERSLRKAHRLRPLLDPRAIREGEAFGFTLIGEPSDPPDLRVLTAECDEKTPTTRWHSRCVAKWSELHRFFGPDGTPTILRTP
jgi:hypothetical protein